MKNKKNGISPDFWRYVFIGDANYILDNFHYVNPESRIIETLDNQPETVTGPDIHSILESIPQRYKDILWEYYFDGLTLEKMGSNRSVTKQYMHQELKKGLSLMKKAIQNERNNL
jgi:DNA-directed RNA polymerase specialized sigma subunit